MQEQRFELKYWLPETRAVQVREFVQQYLALDPFGVGRPHLSYPVHSLYLDSPGLDTYRHTLNGNKNRYKLRLRYYDDRPHSPVFFEIKRRMNNVILKERGGVRKEFVPHLLAGHWAEPAHLLAPDSGTDLRATQHFQELMLSLQARPKMHVAYLREAYENEGDTSVRVTMDRVVLVKQNPTPELRVESVEPVCVFGPTVILELKFTDRFPGWFNTLVQRFDCTLSGAAKYAGGVELSGENWAEQPLPSWIRKSSSLGSNTDI